MSNIDYFVEQYKGLAQKRGVGPESPISFSLEDEQNTFILLVSFTEPTFSKTPYNVLWIDPNRDTVLRRVSHEESTDYNGTWEEVLSYGDLFTYPQSWQPVLDNPIWLGISLVALTLPKATTEDHGIIVLSEDASGPFVVEDNDPRLSDKRDPSEHDHADYPRTMLKVGSDVFVYVDGSTPPSTKHLLFLESKNEDGTFNGVWRQPSELDVDWKVAGLNSLTITTPLSLADHDSYYLGCSASWSTGQVEPNPDGITWSVDDSRVTLDEDGKLTIPNTSESYTFVLTATKRDPRTFRTIRTSETITVLNQYDPIVSISIEGPDWVWEETSTEYRTIGQRESGATVDLGTSPIMDNDHIASGVLSAPDVSVDTASTLHADYMFEGNMLQSEKEVTIKAILPTRLEIQGPSEVNESETYEYSTTVTYNNGVSRSLLYSDLSSFTASSSKVALTEYYAEIGRVIVDTSFILAAQYTEDGVSVKTSIPVRIRNTRLDVVALTLVCGSSVFEDSSIPYSVIAEYDDGSSKEVNADISIQGPLLDEVDSFKGQEVTEDTECTITASYTENDITLTSTTTVRVLDIRLTGLNLLCSDRYVREQTSTSFSVQALFSNGSIKDLSYSELDSFLCSEPDLAQYSSYDVYFGSVTSNTSVTFTATYSKDGHTESDTWSGIILDTVREPTSVRIVGETTLIEGTSTSYKLEVTYDDGYTQLLKQSDGTTEWSAGEHLSISDGSYHVDDLTQDETSLVSCTLTLRGKTFPAELSVILVDIYPVSLSLTGPTTVNEGSLATLHCTVTLSDGSTKNIVPSLSSLSFTFDGLDAAADMVDANKQATIIGTYQHDSYVVSDNHLITIVDTTVYPSSLEISGPDSLYEGSTGNYSVLVHYTDGSVQIASPSDLDSWVVDSPAYFGDDLRKLIVPELTEDQTVTIVGSVTEEGITVSSNLDVALVDNTIEGLQIAGPDEVDEQQFGTFVVQATFRKGDTQTIQLEDLDSFTSSSDKTTLEGLRLSVGTLYADDTTILECSYTSGGDTRTASKVVNLIDSVYPISAEISGPSSIKETETGSFALYVTYSNGTKSPYPFEEDYASFDKDIVSYDQSGNNLDITPDVVSVSQDVVLSASFVAEGKPLSADYTFEVKNTDPIPVSLEFTPSTKGIYDSETTETALSLIVGYDDQSSQRVQFTEANLAVDKDFISYRESGDLLWFLPKTVDDREVVTLTASYLGLTAECVITVTHDQITIYANSEHQQVLENEWSQPLFEIRYHIASSGKSIVLPRESLQNIVIDSTDVSFTDGHYVVSDSDSLRPDVDTYKNSDSFFMGTLVNRADPLVAPASLDFFIGANLHSLAFDIILQSVGSDYDFRVTPDTFLVGRESSLNLYITGYDGIEVRHTGYWITSDYSDNLDTRCIVELEPPETDLSYTLYMTGRSTNTGEGYPKYKFNEAGEAQIKINYYPAKKYAYLNHENREYAERYLKYSIVKTVTVTN